MVSNRVCVLEAIIHNPHPLSLPPYFADNAKIDCTKSRNSLLCRGKRGDKLVAAAALTPAALIGPGSTVDTGLAVPVQIVDHPVNAVVNESGAALFNCGFQALSNESQLVLKWRKDGKVIRKWDIGVGSGGNGGSELDDGGVTESSMFRDDGKNFCMELSIVLY